MMKLLYSVIFILMACVVIIILSIKLCNPFNNKKKVLSVYKKKESDMFSVIVIDSNNLIYYSINNDNLIGNKISNTELKKYKFTHKIKK